MSGCSAESQQEWKNLAMPNPATEQADHIFYLWRWAWVAALITGVIVWGLIFWAIWRYRRRHADEIPVQTRYNLPLEIFYTIAPIIMVIVFFKATVDVQNAVLADTDEDHVVNVVGQQWSWTFNYTDEEAVGGEGTNVYTAGTGSDIPTLVLPVGETTQFNLYSPDVIHSFGVPGFLMKMDVIPGRVNHYEVTPDTIGTFKGKCYELCGSYHSRMLFNVEVVSPEDFDQYLQDLEEAGFVSQEPILGGADAYTQSGLDEDDDEEGSAE
ncbi:cytochrome c oxidase subunit II [Nocardioides sp. GCM10027113]|uniref:aa3-type cytochrome oxidase subunit II n=1 Tax=unclassified Nocardioides TaxID=2615069 RepID=UPI0036201CE7